MAANTVSTTDTPPQIQTATASAVNPPAGVVLREISWNEYVTLRDRPANARLRMTYHRGDLEIMTLSPFHELVALLIHDFILEWRVARRLAVCPTGSMTLRRPESGGGVEGDQSYYIANESAVRGLDRIDLQNHPPPDLAVEVEFQSPSVDKMPIYASIGVPELWRWREETLTVHRLVDGEYIEQTHSEALTDFPLDRLRSALARRHQVDETSLVAEFRKSLELPTEKKA